MGKDNELEFKKLKGYEENAHDIAESPNKGPEIKNIEEAEMKQAILDRNDLYAVSLSDLNSHVDSLNIDTEVKELLKRLIKANLAHFKISDYFRK